MGKDFYRVILFLLLIVSPGVSLYAHHKGRVIGKILSQDKTPIEAVSIGIKGTDKGTYTDENGDFDLFIKEGERILVLSYLGNPSKEIEVYIAGKSTTDLGEIIYNISGNELDAITIEGGNGLTKKNSVYVARMPLTYIENPQVYTVIPKELIATQVAMNMEDVLKNVSGASNVARGFGSGGVGVQIMQRGFSSGINMRNGMSTNTLALTDPINIERIEVIKGPSGTLFGSTVSYGGLVNKVTKKPFAAKDFRFSYSAGSWSNNRVTADINMPLNKDNTLLFRLNALYASNNSYMANSPMNKSWAIDPSLTYIVNSKLKFNLDIEIFRNEGLTSYAQILSGKEASLYNSGVHSMKDFKYDWKRSYADKNLISSTQTFNSYFEALYDISDNWHSQTVYSHSGVDLESNYLFLNFVNAETFTRTINHIPATFDRDQFQQNFVGDFKLGTMKNKLLVGLDYLYTKNENTRNSIVYDKSPLNFNAPTNKILMPIERVDSLLNSNSSNIKAYGSPTSTYSAYITDILNITDQLSLMAALRVDRYVNTDYKQTALSPKFGAVYEIIKDQLSVFGNYQSGFSNTQPSQSDSLGNYTNWKPEKAIQWEGGIKTQIWGDRLVATLGVYNIKVKDILRSIQYIGGSYKEQGGERVSKGFDIDITALPIQGWTVILGYGYNDSKLQKMLPDATGNSLDGNRPSNLPLHSINFWTDYKLSSGQLKGLGLGVGGNYIGKNYYSDNNLIYNPARFMMDASVYYAQSNYRVSFKLNNIFDYRGWTLGRGAQPVKPREILGSVSFQI